MPDPLISTKLHIPSVRKDLVIRPRLVKQLDAALERRLTILSAPAGFGKTTLLTGFVTRRWGEARVIQASLVCAAAGFVLLLLANTFPAVLATTGLYISSTTFLRPSIHALTSKRASLGQGAAMGLSNSFVSLGRVVGPIYAGVIFDVNPSLPYISGAVILLVCFAISLVWLGRDIPQPG